MAGPDDDGGGGQVRDEHGDALDLAAVVSRARGLSGEALDAARDIMRKPVRNAVAKLAAAKLVLDIAGAGAAATDQRHAELLAFFKRKLSKPAYAEVVRALADDLGAGEGGSESDSGGSPH